jgi:endonuclease G, mitochondrial
MVERKGYDENFLGSSICVPMPEISLENQNDVITITSNNDQTKIDYVHYSVKMSKSNRQAYFSAANIDQDKYKDNILNREWFLDPRVGYENQIGEEAYTKNCWDRGHLTRRADVTWGDDFEAKNASNDSCCYTNACLQHENFNQDEWTVPEEVIHNFNRDLNNKLCVLTGPVFTSTDRWYTRAGMEKAVRIPSAFWKVVAYIDKETNELSCQAFVMYQDSLFCKDKRGKEKLDINNYQVTITEIEKLTGLVFHKDLFNSNPLFYYPRENINDGPEAFYTPSRNPRKNRPLADGIVFSRRDIGNTAIQKRRTELTKADFEEHVRRSIR